MKFVFAIGTTVALLAATGMSISGGAARAAVSASNVASQAGAVQSAASADTPATSASGIRPDGRWTWWGYRTDRWQTWAIATQSPSYIRWSVLPFFGAYVYVQAWVWKLTAQNARSMGLCLGITWSGSGIIVGCA
jgi:hypothetical protein